MGETFLWDDPTHAHDSKTGYYCAAVRHDCKTRLDRDDEYGVAGGILSHWDHFLQDVHRILTGRIGGSCEIRRGFDDEGACVGLLADVNAGNGNNCNMDRMCINLGLHLAESVVSTTERDVVNSRDTRSSVQAIELVHDKSHRDETRRGSADVRPLVSDIRLRAKILHRGDTDREP